MAENDEQTTGGEAPEEQPSAVAEAPDPEVAEPEVEEPAEVEVQEAAVDEPAPEPEPAPAPKAKTAPKTKGEPKPTAKKETPRRAPAKPARKKVVERTPIVRLPKPEHERGRPKERRGVVVSNAMDKTIVVRVDTVKPHPRYKKVVRRSKKFHAHDEGNVAKPGDFVRIVETRPLSALKRWRLAEVMEEAR